MQNDERLVHYVALIKIEKVTLTTLNRGLSGETKREVVSEVAKVVIKSDQLDSLKTKVAAHIALVE